MVKLQESGGRYFLTVPKNMVLKKGWVKGEELVLIFNERGNVEIAEEL